MIRIAIPVACGKLSAHFGHCEKFAIIDVDEEKKEIIKHDMIDAPPHQPGLLPVWLKDRGANVIIAGGMGVRAQQLFASSNITVTIGAPSEAPEAVAKAFLRGTLQTGPNVCDNHEPGSCSGQGRHGE